MWDKELRNLTEQAATRGRYLVVAETFPIRMKSFRVIGALKSAKHCEYPIQQ